MVKWLVTKQANKWSAGSAVQEGNFVCVQCARLTLNW